MSPTEVVRKWIEKFNLADIDGLVDLYSFDAVNEQAVLSEPLQGHQAIQRLLKLDFSRAKMICIEERIYECGDTAILQWRDPNGLKGCGFFQIENDRITHQRGYFDQLSFFKTQGLPIPKDYLDTE